MTKHTPTPWVYSDSEILAINAKNSRWTNNIGDPLVVCSMGEYVDGYGYTNFDNYRNNAYFIVRAVNAHENLCNTISTAIMTIKNEYPTLAKSMAEILAKAKGEA